MTKESALKASGGRRAVPTGFRRLTPGLLKADRTAEGFAGLPDNVTLPGQLLAAFKAAAPRLGLSTRLVHALDWLFRFTQPQDWGRGGRPIVWPSASVQQEALGLSSTRVKAVNRALIEAGLISMKDSPNGKRYGKRDPKGRIVEAYGFDLSPMAVRHAEFRRLAEEAKVERVEMGRLRRRATIARNGIAQILETVAEYGFQGEEWLCLVLDSRDIAQALRGAERPEALALGVGKLERRQHSAHERLESLLVAIASPVPEAVNPDPLGAENRPHQYTYKSDPYPYKDTVMTAWGKITVEEEVSSSAPSSVPKAISKEIRQPVQDTGKKLKLQPEGLVRLAPRLKIYLRRPNPSWPDIIDAADWLRSDLDVSKSLWGEACLAMGREQAAIAIAIVSTKDPEHFRTTAGGYFHGMVMKAKVGELNLDRTLWGLRQRQELGPRRDPKIRMDRATSSRLTSKRPWT